MIHIKTPEEIEIMRAGGKILARVLRTVADEAKEGVNLLELDQRIESLIRASGGTPSFKGYRRYPAASCLSVNDEVVHGLPRDYALKQGDLLSIDIGVYYEWFHTDAALTIGIGHISSKARDLLEVTRHSLELALHMVRPGVTLGDLGHAIEAFAKEHNMGVVRELVGHGVGRELQEEPQIPNFGLKGKGVMLEEGMTLAIEPMLTAGKETVFVAEDNFTFKTKDSSLAAHFEHTVAVTEDGCEVLTTL